MDANSNKCKTNIKHAPLLVSVINRDNYPLIISVISIVIAVLSLSVVIYKEFIESYNISAHYDQIILLRLPAGNKNKILKDIVINELISGNPEFLNKEMYKSNPEIYAKYPDIKDAAKKRDKDRLSQLFKELKIYNYKPPENLIRKYFGVQAFSPSFCIPLIIANSGAKFAPITNLYLVINSEEENDKRWLFRCFMEVDLKSLLERKDKKDVDRISKLFIGTSIGPKEKIKLSPAFMPCWKIGEEEIISTSMTPGFYKTHIVGYGPDKQKVFETTPQKFHLSDTDLIKMFKGTDRSELIEPEEIMLELIRQ